jgi:hypothetical protein
MAEANRRGDAYADAALRKLWRAVYATADA